MKSLMRVCLFLCAAALGEAPALAWSAQGFTKPSRDALKKSLDPLSFAVTQEADTERPFKNRYWDNHEEGIYVDVVSGEPLFSSRDKFESGTGWPSFTRPLEKGNIVEREDRSFFSVRTEVRSRHGDSHLGHVFDDGPKPTGLRYCMNSAALRFIPAARLAAEGYAEYAPLFASASQGASPTTAATAAAKPAPATTEATAVFAGGCFWCMEPPFEALPGVIAVYSGYTGGKVPNPTYADVSSGTTGHLEAVQVVYDPSKVTYEALLDTFWHNIDPTDAGGSFVDRGPQYRSAVFVANTQERAAAEASKAALDASGVLGKKVVTEILEAGPFYKAEEYHQDYYKKNPVRYKFYRWNSGRDQFLEKTWGKGKGKS